jgi:hypothetical protein
MFSASFRQGITTDTSGAERSSASVATGGFVSTTVLMAAVSGARTALTPRLYA